MESTRSIPRSPGVNAGAVLREAVAARTRRKVRDAVLLVLAVVLLATGTGFQLGLWFLGAAVAAAVVAVISGQRIRPGKQPKAVAPYRRVPLALGGVAGAIALFFVMYKVIEELDRPSASYCRRYPTACEVQSDGELAVMVVVIALIFAVLLTDRVLVWLLVTKSFRRRGFRASRGPEELWRNEWTLRRLGNSGYDSALRLFPAEDDEPAPADQAQVTVYHGYRPFVGSGTMFEPWSMALPLKPTEEHEDMPRPGFELPELYDRLTAELLKTGRSPSLSPGHRLKDLTTGDRVVISAVELVDHIDDVEARIVLPNKDDAPRPTVDRSVVDGLITRPMEWMRYFRSFQVETWDRDVVVSAYLTFGLDEEMLYVEWTPCILHPIEARHRQIDVLPEQSVRPLLEALLDLLTFPASLPRRFATAVNWLVPVHQAEGTYIAERYGATTSLRELASERQVDNYFQLTDIERYVKVLESRLLRTLGEFLESKGISVTEFMEQAMQVTNNNVHITGPVISSNVASTGRARAGNVKTGREKG
ncbi:hypothetical protein BBK82_20605 [Lentzea guizhouensis]|uniref:Uncharacterized protein n=1 Tax=Lentzea guizhouensis TaxID=1586287 RepID=A0A1B2HK57_9PSEU|nr:hypothetical protein BBK82_20605 [Lentzea guizhouensis]